MEWLIPLLMFAFPVLIALLDKQARKRKNVPPVQSQPIFPPAMSGSEAFPEVAPENRATLGTVRGGTASEAQRWGPTQEDVFRGKPPGRVPEAASTEKTEEGLRAISKERRKGTEQKKVNPEPKLEIDKKKLILYSEILKPKFDA